MNLNELFQQQKALDQRIVKEKGLQGKDLFEDKTVALICELYECVNESRHFKFWSEDKKPNTRQLIRDIEGKRYKNPLLEEYIDVVHFTLSIANDLGYHSHECIPISYKGLNNLIIIITKTAADVSLFRDGKLNSLRIEILVGQVIQLGYELGFTEEQVIAAYYDKNKINHARQDNGY